MNILNLKLIFGLAILFICCAAMQNRVYNDDLRNEAIRIAVNDFLDKCSLQKTDSVFSVNIYIDNDDILGVSISSVHENKIYPSTKDKIGAETNIFPSHYIERNNKLIYWGDSTQILSNEIVNVLSKYNQIDSTFINDEKAYPEFVINEKIRGAHYYFCKKDLSQFKRVVTNKGMNSYDPPKLKCNSK
ncbi:hypothetical protein CLV62_104138 [Dysgonomonas alginatilytica]|uniref:Uncharacterized protein n=1 Tax=Dysgonomonas alginatilytica TaxID=1605892 RepID=A0A2V3PR67_9BACT|nr:hypothetical protein [Dysgonomonas alginatilytica]PXV66877.1 hypothetical protein CLV62_104138 [Dysgonomonas alginatilytica]